MKTESMKIVNNKLYMGFFELDNLASEFSTPLYVYDEVGVRKKLETFKNNFKSDFINCEVVYASKAFLAPYLVDIIKEYNFSIDAVSLGDLYILKKSGFDPSKIVFHGNGKTKKELEEAVDIGVQYLVVDSIHELSFLEEIANKKEKTINTLFRVNPGIHAGGHKYIETANLNSKFGESIYDDEIICKIASIYKNSKYLIFKGFHSHIGSQITSTDAFIKEIDVMIEFIEDFENKYGLTVDTLDLGGGFAIKYLETDAEFNLKETLNAIVESVIKNKRNIKNLLIEPGRSIVGDSCVTLYKVLGKKMTYGKKEYIIVDGGMADNIRPCLYDAKYEVENASNFESEEKREYCVVGKCCESGDIVRDNVLLGEVKTGDTLCIYSTGAYCYSMSSNYNSLTRGAVIFINNDKLNIAIKKERLEDLTKNYNFEYNKDQFFFDMHSDMLYDLSFNGTRRLKDYHINNLKNSKIKAAVWTLYSPCDFNLKEKVLDALNQIKRDMTDDFPFGVLLGFESLRNLEKKEDIIYYYDLGFRHAMLTWNEENKYATGVNGSSDRGLTTEGEGLVKLMMEKDMIIDLAHLNEKSFFDVINITKNYKNIIYSHGNIKEICPHKRNITRDEMLALKETNGILGLTLAGSFIGTDKDDRTLEKFLDHVEYAIDVMGEDNVGFGFDFMDYLDEFTNSNIEEIKDATNAHLIIDGLRRRGFSEDIIKKITFDNFYKRFKDKLYRGI